MASYIASLIASITASFYLHYSLHLASIIASIIASIYFDAVSHVRSASAASCAIPGLFEPPELYQKIPETGQIVPYKPGMTWLDGSIANDLPTAKLAEVFNAKNWIASQVCVLLSVCFWLFLAVWASTIWFLLPSLRE